MNLTQYAPLAARTEKMFDHEGRLNHASLGIFTELGELANAVKRVGIYGKAWDSYVDAKAEKPQTLRANALEEIGDTAWYIAIAFNEAGVPMEYSDTHQHLDSNEFNRNDRIVRLTFLAGVQWSKYEQNKFWSQRDALAALSMLLSILRNLCSALDGDFEVQLQHNIDKLVERYPDKYSDEAAEARADKGGLSATVS